ncbi:MAG: PorV/PorQ family protein [Ignavibacteriaceae bacterium]|jgi:hypothetical protein
MKNILKILLAFILLLAMDAFAGGGKRTGTGGAAELLIPVGPRGIAMAEANIANSKGIEALYWNPAGVALMQNNADVIFSHMSYIADIGVEYGAVAANFEGFGVFSFSIKSLGVGDILVTTTANPDGTGDTFSPTFIVAGLSYSRQLTEAISVGLTGNFISETMADVSANGFAFDVGVMYNNLADVNGLSIGVVIKNLGPDMKYTGGGLYHEGQITDVSRPPSFYTVEAAAFQLPSNFQLGLGYSPVLDEMNSLQFSGIYQNNNFSGDEYKIGGEYGYQDMFFVRGGYQLAPQISDDYLYGFTAGVGINYSVENFGFKVDYAFRDVQFFEANHVIALTLTF